MVIEGFEGVGGFLGSQCMEGEEGKILGPGF